MKSNTTLSSIVGAKSGNSKDSAFDGVKITADKWTNSLVINAKPRQYEAIKSVVEGLDIRKGQVLFDDFHNDSPYLLAGPGVLAARGSR